MPILTEDQANKLDRSMGELGLSARALNVLKTARIQKVRDLVAYTPQGLMDVESCGKKTVGEIETMLKDMGLKLGMELPVEKISGISLVELAVAFATRSEAECTYTDPYDGHEVPNRGLRVHSLKRWSHGGQSLYMYDIEIEFTDDARGTSLLVLYDEVSKEGRAKWKQPDSSR